MADRNNPDFLSASTIKGDKVVNAAGEDLGKIEELMIDLRDGRLAFAVLSFGGFLGLGDKLFAIPWQALRLKLHDHAFVLDVPKDVLEKAEGFDKDNWPIPPMSGFPLYTATMDISFTGKQKCLKRSNHRRWHVWKVRRQVGKIQISCQQAR